MLNKTAFVLLAGDPEKWDEEIREFVPSINNDKKVFQSKTLCEMQVNQSARGRRSAHMVLSIHGWTVRYASGLQNFGILFKSGTNDPKVALDWGIAWANQDPSCREFFISRSEMRKDLEFDWSKYEKVN